MLGTFELATHVGRRECFKRGNVKPPISAKPADVECVHMRKINIRLFRESMLKELGDLPFELTRNGEVVAVVSAMGVPEKKESLKKPVKKVQEVPEWSGGYSKGKQLGR